MAQKKRTELPACSLKPTLEDRSLISSEEAGEIMALFKVLTNDTRLRLIHALARSGELCVSDLAAAVGMKPQAVSNQLQRLSDRGILKTRRDGNNIHYRIVDPCVLRLLELGLCLIEEGRTRTTNRWAMKSGTNRRQIMEKKGNEVKSGKKGLWAILKESMNKANSGCGPGCGCHIQNQDKGKRREDAPDKPMNDKEQA